MGDLLRDVLGALVRLVPYLAVAAVLVLLLLGLRWVLLRRAGELGERLLGRQVVMLGATCVAIVVLVLFATRADPSLRSDLLGLVGLLLSAMVALSATTFVSNAMAGVMLRVVGSFRPGDFVRVGDLFGRVTERGLFHVEIQTPDRDLATLPNLLVVTGPVTVVRASGTIVSANVSIGYDEAHDRIEALLLEGVRAAELEEPFVQVVELGDHAVTYRAAGFLADVATLLSARSRLHSHVLDALHGAGVEIVSPAFVNQRRLAREQRFVPARTEATHPSPAAGSAPEAVVFDKAERAARREDIVKRLEAARAELDSGDDVGEGRRSPDAMRSRIERLEKLLERSAVEND